MVCKNSLIVKLVPSIERWVQGFIKKFPDFRQKYDDLVGESVTKMVVIVNGLGDDPLENFDGNFDKFSSYIRLSTWTAMTDFIRSDCVVIQPHSLDAKTPCEQMRREPLVSDEPLTETAALNKLFNCIKDQKDAKIVRAKLDGAKTAKDVQKVTGFSTATIYRRLRAIKTRYDQHK